ncbi:hypothetical protein BI037_gp07 [Morganella phage vB_MmoP_MP2]|uniref:Uncharacterized protein n=1 Tax=Morganella phage vB_MmoP_MP2 TaxID=1852627 RepID=A0A192YBY9_9CAUD|nr:hypothetical protein BI037_gp07 [Morganella phage vB_MmoP_MP2]ANM46366.1 hypothetical protein MP2_gp07 [Morganella phage vB_MmoP_MP2]
MSTFNQELKRFTSNRHIFVIPREDLTKLFGMQDEGSFKCDCSGINDLAYITIINPHDGDYMQRTLATYDIRFRSYECTPVRYSLGWGFDHD